MTRQLVGELLAVAALMLAGVALDAPLGVLAASLLCCAVWIALGES